MSTVLLVHYLYTFDFYLDDRCASAIRIQPLLQLYNYYNTCVVYTPVRLHVTPSRYWISVNKNNLVFYLFVSFFFFPLHVNRGKIITFMLLLFSSTRHAVHACAPTSRLLDDLSVSTVTILNKVSSSPKSPQAYIHHILHTRVPHAAIVYTVTPCNIIRVVCAYP